MRRTWMRLALATVLATTAAVFAVAPAAHAESTYRLSCAPTSYTGSGWYYYQYGGYCDGSIHYAVTPTGGKNGTTASWTFTNLSLNGRYRIDAWIPWYYANAKMDWDTALYVPGLGTSYGYYPGFDEAPVWSWQSIESFTMLGASGATLTVKAWSGMVTPNYYLGVDAIQIVYLGP
jgi:hypothetical protein